MKGVGYVRGGIIVQGEYSYRSRKSGQLGRELGRPMLEIVLSASADDGRAEATAQGAGLCELPPLLAW